MSDKTNERIEREARESLVAADLSAKMKQWRDQQPPPDRGGKGGGSRLRLLLMLLAIGGAAWWLWPKSDNKVSMPSASPVEQPAPVPPPPISTPPPPPTQVPMAEKSAGNKYLAMAQANYRAPNFAADIRGDSPQSQNALNDARRALADQRPADAIAALQNIPAAYQTDADYLRAHALCGQKKYAQAAVIFGKLKTSVRYGEAAQWFEILAMLPGFEENKALIMRQLKKIADDDGHTFQLEARRLLQSL